MKKIVAYAIMILALSFCFPLLPLSRISAPVATLAENITESASALFVKLTH